MPSYSGSYQGSHAERAVGDPSSSDAWSQSTQHEASPSQGALGGMNFEAEETFDHRGQGSHDPYEKTTSLGPHAGPMGAYETAAARASAFVDDHTKQAPAASLQDFASPNQPTNEGWSIDDGPQTDDRPVMSFVDHNPPTVPQPSPDFAQPGFGQTSHHEDFAASQDAETAALEKPFFDPPADAAVTAHSRPSWDALQAGHASAPERASMKHKALPKPRLEKDFVFAPKVALPSLFRRALAGGIDMALMLGVAAFLTMIAGPASKLPFPKGIHGMDLLATILQRYTEQFSFFLMAFVAVGFLYVSILHSINGQTLGKMLLGLKVIERNGQPLSILGVLARSLAFFIFLFLGLVGLSWIFVDKEYRGIHDRLSGALVIRTPPSS